jgi:hypothetical protein
MIVFFSMDGCVFCKKVEAELHDEIKKGRVHKKAHTEAPEGTNGFPTFMNTDTGKIVTGYKPKAQLFEALGVNMENYEHTQDDEHMQEHMQHHGYMQEHMQHHGHMQEHMQHHGHMQEHMQHHGHMPHHMQKRAAAPTSCSEHYGEVATPKGAWGYATLGNYWR